MFLSAHFLLERRNLAGHNSQVNERNPTRMGIFSSVAVEFGVLDLQRRPCPGKQPTYLPRVPRGVPPTRGPRLRAAPRGEAAQRISDRLPVPLHRAHDHQYYTARVAQDYDDYRSVQHAQDRVVAG